MVGVRGKGKERGISNQIALCEKGFPEANLMIAVGFDERRCEIIRETSKNERMTADMAECRKRGQGDADVTIELLSPAKCVGNGDVGREHRNRTIVLRRY